MCNSEISLRNGVWRSPRSEASLDQAQTNQARINSDGNSSNFRTQYLVHFAIRHLIYSKHRDKAIVLAVHSRVLFLTPNPSAISAIPNLTQISGHVDSFHHAHHDTIENAIAQPRPNQDHGFSKLPSRVASLGLTSLDR